MVNDMVQKEGIKLYGTDYNFIACSEKKEVAMGCSD